MSTHTSIKWLTLCVVLCVSGCANTKFPQEQALTEQATRHGVELPTLSLETSQPQSMLLASLLEKELDFQSVAQIALLNNPDFLATLAKLKVSQTQLEQAGLLPNPGLSLSRVRGDAGYETEFEFGFNLVGLLFRSQEVTIASDAYHQEELNAAQALVTLIAQSQSAFADAVTAQQRFNYLLEVQEAIDASAELAKRMYQVGNYSLLQQSRAQKFAAEVKLQLAQAQQQLLKSKEHLFVRLGLWGSQLQVTLPSKLPALPHHLKTLPDEDSHSLVNRLDLRQAKLALQQQAKQLNLTQSSRFLRNLHAEFGGSVQHSQSRELTLGFELPLFDRHSTRLSQAEALLQKEYFLAQSKAVKARSQIRQSAALREHDYQIAKHYQENLVPLAATINKENLLRYNGMLIGVFELIAETQAQVSTITNAMQALNAYHQASIRYQQALWTSAEEPEHTAGISASPTQAPAGH